MVALKAIIYKDTDLLVCIIIVKLSLYSPWRPLGLREVEAPTFSNIRLIDGGKVVPLRVGRFLPPMKIPGTHNC
jgi:hypothetical protein